MRPLLLGLEALFRHLRLEVLLAVSCRLPRMVAPQGYPGYGGVPQPWARGPPPPGAVVPPPQVGLPYAGQPVPMGVPPPGVGAQGTTVSNTNVFDGAAQKAVKNDLGLVYSDEKTSMVRDDVWGAYLLHEADKCGFIVQEEKRALRPKYAYKPLGATASASVEGAA